RALRGRLGSSRSGKNSPRKSDWLQLIQGPSPPGLGGLWPPGLWGTRRRPGLVLRAHSTSFGAVDALADQIGVAVVPRVLLDHVGHDPAHGIFADDSVKRNAVHDVPADFDLAHVPIKYFGGLGVAQRIKIIVRPVLRIVNGRCLLTSDASS